MAFRKKARASENVAAVAEAAPVVGRLVEDAELRATLREAVDSAERAYERLTSRKRGKKTPTEKKVKSELKGAVKLLNNIAGELGDDVAKRKRSRGGIGFGAKAALVLGGGVVIVGTCPWMRGKLLDALFGAEEEFEYSPPPMPEASAPVPAGVAPDAGTSAVSEPSAPATDGASQ